MNSFMCVCLAGYTGSNCSLDIDDCNIEPCMNGATCLVCQYMGSKSKKIVCNFFQDEVDGFSCVCLAGYSGMDCSVNIDDCSDNPCDNGGTCIVSCFATTYMVITYRMK